MSVLCAVWQKWDGNAGHTLDAMAALLAASGGERVIQDFVKSAGVAALTRTASAVFRNQNVILVCDVDLINAHELAKECSPAVPGDGALLAALYERYGASFVDRLRGAFAFILWDLREQCLIAAIDGFGIKRLAWYEDDKNILIASRVDALRVDEADLQINPRALANVLNFSSNLAPETIFTRVKRLAPGTLLTASARGTATRQYWGLRYGIETGAHEDQLSRQLESVVERSVADHCAGDFRETGAFLSGGTDSSTVVGMMTRAAGGPVKAYSIGFAEEGFNELGYAELAARKFHAEHHTYLVTARDCVDAIPEMIRSFDEPFGNSSAIPTYFCARLAAQTGVKTLLAGDGGDELFGGNERYATDQIFEVYHRVPKLFRKALIEPVASLPLPIGLWRRAKGYIRRANMSGVERMLSFQFLRTHSPNDVFDGDFLRSLAGYDIIDIPAAHYAGAAAQAHLDRLLHVDMKITLADNDLPKVTSMSGLAGIRTRFPFLDRTVAEFSGRIPANLKVKGMEKRYLFKKAFRELLPPEIIQKKKHGFGIPVALWMKSDPRMRELTRDTLLSARAFGRGYFRKAFIEELFQRHETEDAVYYGDTLWTFLAIELWHRQVVDRTPKVMA